MSDEQSTPEEAVAEDDLPVTAPPAVAGELVPLAAAVPTASWSESVTGQTVVQVEPQSVVALAEAARDGGFEMFIDVTAVDYYRQRPGPRYDVVIGLLSLQHNQRLRILVPVDADQPSVPSITGVYPGANFFEREVFDMFGIEFTGHSDLTRILLPDDWEGHPLRKDTPVGSVPVQFRDTHKVQ